MAGWLKRAARKLFSAGTGAGRAVKMGISGDIKDFKLFENQSIGKSYKDSLAGSAVVGAAALGGTKLKEKMALTNNEIGGTSGNPLANAPKKLSWEGVKKVGQRFYDAYGKEIVGKELQALGDKVKNKLNQGSKGGTVIGGQTKAGDMWEKIKSWFSNNWVWVLVGVLSIGLLWFFFGRKKSYIKTTRRASRVSPGSRRSGMSRSPSKRQKQLAALAKGRRTRMRNLRAKRK